MTKFKILCGVADWATLRLRGYTPENIAVAARIDASGCASLTELHAPVAADVVVSGCMALTELHAPAAETIDASGCASLTELHAPVATRIDVSGCTQWSMLYRDPRCYELRMIPTTTGSVIVSGCRLFRSVSDAMAHWGSPTYPNKERGAAYCAALAAFTDKED